MIVGKNIRFSYDDSKEFIKELNINIQRGKVTTILGPNGSGKSTLLSLLCGINKIKGGEILIDNNNINKMKYKDIAKVISTVHQQNSVPNDITVESLISYGRLPHKKFFEKDNREDKEIIDWAIKCTGLEEYREKKVMSLSGGERQRVFISMALAQKPEVLFLDEPTTYLDIYHQIEILELVKKINEELGITVVMVLHDINQAVKYSHNIAIMKNGSLIKSGNSKSIVNKDLLRDVYKVDGYISTLDDDKYFIPMTTCNF